jgi:hypothetical protein
LTFLCLYPKARIQTVLLRFQELMGGKFGEMSTLMNYTFQSFNFRGLNSKRNTIVLAPGVDPEMLKFFAIVRKGLTGKDLFGNS